ncbi:MAG TPA: LssY C-terminal domain-containing protein [Bryobacteraceae bacterium]|nr:LssY C-terminal domain-containing protein [Bryobacteraceae bacterium]
MTSARIVLLLFAGAAVVRPQAGGPARKQLTITGSADWTDTGIEVQPGDTVAITATGRLQYSGAKATGPDGLERSFMDLLRILPLNDAGRGALLGRIGDSPAARPFLVGDSRKVNTVIAGRLFLAVNQMANEKPGGSYQVTINRVAGAKPTAGAAMALPPFTQSQLDTIPTRVVDSMGNSGDRTNFVVIGSQNQVESALKAAGWVLVDKTKTDVVIRGLISSFSKQSYVTLPMSELTLYGRSQDYGWAQADPLLVIQSRHHFRLWKAPFLAGGQTVWVGAGTHDIGLEKDQRTGNLTHKIDPQVDKERDYIGSSLSQSGLVAKLDYMTPSRPVTTAKTATGGQFSSDGRTLIVYLRPDTVDFSARFADLFCSTLKQNNPDTGQWGPCSRYLSTPGKETVSLPPIPTTYRILIVPGILSSCVADTPAFLEGQKALREKYGLTVELLQVSNDSSEDNAKTIGRYLQEHTAGSDKRKYIVIGYSKGAPDVQTALAREQGVAAAVAAFATVAGASGGSPIADVMPAQADKWIQMFRMGTCKGDLSAGFKSLRKSVRQAFLADYPDPLVPTYSLAAASDRAGTSKALLQSWQLLSSFGTVQDGQLMRDDALVPKAKMLGILKGDHFAVALPFNKSPNTAMATFMGSAYPRAALLEAVVRFVLDDLGNK